MCFMKPPETPAASPPVSDTTAADQLGLGTNAVSQRSASILGRLGLMSSKGGRGGGERAPSSSSAPEQRAADKTPAPGATPQTKTGGGTLGTLRGIVPHYLRKPPAP